MIKDLEVILILYTAISAMISIYAFYDGYIDFYRFNPQYNYEKWDNLNWLGVWCGTILIIILFYPAAICYVVYRLFRWLFTVGRKK